MNSSALLEEKTQLEMDNPRKEQEELNLNELNSFLNSIMNKCRSKIFYCRQAQILIGNTADAMTEISNLKKANENLKQTNEQLKGSIQTTSNENSNLKQQNQQYNKQIEDLLDYKRAQFISRRLIPKRIPSSRLSPRLGVEPSFSRERSQLSIFLFWTTAK